MDDADEPDIDADLAREQQERRDYFEVVTNFQGRQWEASKAYNQIIVFGAFAAFFAVWSATINTLPRWIVLSSGALILVAVTIYVAWVIVGMFSLQSRNAEMMSVVVQGIEGFPARIQTAAARSVQDSTLLMRFWKPIVGLSGGSALSAALLVAGGALAALLTPPVSKAAVPLPRYTMVRGDESTIFRMNTATGQVDTCTTEPRECRTVPEAKAPATPPAGSKLDPPMR